MNHGISMKRLKKLFRSRTARLSYLVIMSFFLLQRFVWQAGQSTEEATVVFEGLRVFSFIIIFMFQIYSACDWGSVCCTRYRWCRVINARMPYTS
jgi:uncharacterized membrane protein